MRFSMPMPTRLASFGLLLLLTACQPGRDLHQAEDWRLYKSRFISSDGRVLDTGNGDVSHSEGQGYGLLLAAWLQDREAFAKVWQWTRSNLQIRDDKLFMWRKRQNVELRDEDHNNASDGDILIAWALLEAAKQWQMPEYETAAKQIMTDIKQKLLLQWHGLPVLLPGEYGFKSADGLTINLSYWIYPAFKAFATTDGDAVWLQVSDSGLALLRQARFGRWQLPADWVQLHGDNSLQAAKNQRFGYDAVRIPLYLVLGKSDTQALQTFADCWAFYRDYTPAWLDLTDNVMDSFGASDGIKAIKQLALWRAGRMANGPSQSLAGTQDYYSSTLLLLSKLAYLQSEQ